MHNTLSFRTIFRNIRYNLAVFYRHPAAWAVGLTFAADSFMFGTWVTLIPFVKARLALSDGELGLALFGMPAGLLSMNPISPRLLQRYGLVNTTIVSTLMMACSFVLPLWAPNTLGLFFTLLLVGISVALMNVAMNTCATNIEEKEGRKIMSTCHGMWSLGGMVGSSWSAVMMKVGAFPPYYLSIQAIVLAVAVAVYLAPQLRKVPEIIHEDDGSARFAFPKGDLLLMILVGACASLCEGIAFDWSAVYLTDRLGAAEQVAALGFTFFSMSMMMMRFAGDALIPAYGERKLLYFTVFACVIAILGIVLANNIWMGIFGFLLLGMGVALAAPILFNAAARVPGFAPGAGLATYATFSFIGFLMGPPAIGLVSEKWGLPTGFIAVGLGMLSTYFCVRSMGYLRNAEY